MINPLKAKKTLNGNNILCIYHIPENRLNNTWKYMGIIIEDGDNPFTTIWNEKGEALNRIYDNSLDLRDNKELFLELETTKNGYRILDISWSEKLGNFIGVIVFEQKKLPICWNYEGFDFTYKTHHLV